MSTTTVINFTLKYTLWLISELLPKYMKRYGIAEFHKNLYICDCLSEKPPSLHLPVFQEIPF